MLKLVGTDGSRYYSWYLDAGRYVIGRKAESDLLIPDKTVSRSHAELEVVSAEGPCYLLDLNSRNGTLVNGERIAARVEVHEGDRIMFGSTDFALTRSEQYQTAGQTRTPTASLFSDGEFEKSVFLNIDDALRPLPAHMADQPEVMATLFEMAKMLVLPEPKEVMLERSLSLVSRAVPAQRLAVLLVGEEKQDPYVAACLVPGESDPGTFTLSRTIVSEILSFRNAVVIGDPATDPRFAGQQSIIMARLKSAMAVPLFAEGVVLGILYADTTDPRHRYGDDYLRLFATFGNLIAFRLLNYSLLSARQEKELIESELRHASFIQRKLLPRSIPHFTGYSIYAYQQQCRSVGGDFYDVAVLPDGRLLFLVADVSGKGIGAALLMSNILASFRILYDEKQFDLTRAVRQVSAKLFAYSEPEVYATLFVGLIDPKEESMTFINAGHNPPPFLVARDGIVTHLEASGTMIGAFDFSEWSAETVRLSQDDLVFVCTDGVNEAERQDQFYGVERALRRVIQLRERSPEDIVRGVLDDVKAFVKDSPQSDDITMLLIKKAVIC